MGLEDDSQRIGPPHCGNHPIDGHSAFSLDGRRSPSLSFHHGGTFGRCWSDFAGPIVGNLIAMCRFLELIGGP